MSRASKKRRAIMAAEREAARRLRENEPEHIDPRAVAAEAPVTERPVKLIGSGRLWLAVMLAAATRMEDEP